MCVCACAVTAMENDIRASEMTKTIFSVWQPQAHLDREEGRLDRKWVKREMEEKKQRMRKEVGKRKSKVVRVRLPHYYATFQCEGTPL